VEDFLPGNLQVVMKTSGQTWRAFSESIYRTFSSQTVTEGKEGRAMMVDRICSLGVLELMLYTRIREAAKVYQILLRVHL